MTGTLLVLRAGEPVRTWDTADPTTIPEPRKVAEQVQAAGGTLLSDGKRLAAFDETKPEIVAIPQHQGG